MPSYVTPKKNTAFRFFVALTQQANPLLLQAAATLASGDVTVSTDGAAFANITTLPVVTPAGGVTIQVDLSATEMNGDNICVLFSDQAGAQWCDLAINIQTTARQVDDLEYGDVQVGDGTLTLHESIRTMIAALAGKLSGAATTTITIRNNADSKDVIVATVDANGNRSAITLTP